MLKGISGSSGFGIGKVFCYQVFNPTCREELIPSETKSAHLSAYQAALTQAQCELNSLVSSLPASQSAIFGAHLEMLEDESIHDEIEDAIHGGASAQWAVYSVFQTYIELMQSQESNVLRERAADLMDVRNRLLRILRGGKESSLAALTMPMVIAARDILPSDVARLDSSLVLAFLTETGGATSHAAILARSLGIPAVLGIPRLMETLRDGQSVIVDGTGGTVLTDPDEATLLHYRQLQQSALAEEAQDREALPLLAETQDGVSIPLSLNIGSADLPESERYADGVGLFRSEFLYMERASIPSEEVQFAAYANALRVMGTRPVILRTLDIGGDKTLPYLPLPKEENPFLGNRAIRLCLDHEEMFRTQLRAAYRAASAGNLLIMFPMIGSVEDFRRARSIALSVRDALVQEGHAIPQVPLGIMIEIPAAALCAEQLAREADFASIGTNDLCQYTFAADRMNPFAVQYAHPLSPAMLKLVRMRAEAFSITGKPLSVCGELAGEARAIPILLGAGVRKLSMSASSLARAKRIIRACTLTDCQALFARAMVCATEQEVIEMADAFLAALHQD